METTTSTAAATVLARARGFRRAADLAEAELLGQVFAWAQLHIVDDTDEGALWPGTDLHLGGPGCPAVSEQTVTELAAALGLSPTSGRFLVAHVLELVFRLPKLWTRVQAGQVQGWRARRVAEHTMCLSMEAASFVDAQVAGFADRVGAAQVERLVEAAIARYMPELARQQREAAADGRHFDINHDQVSFSGTARVDGELDLADALDLDAAIARGAAQLKDLGNDLPLDQRRALAAGEMARAQLGLDLITPANDDDPPVEHGSRGKSQRRNEFKSARDVVIFAHLSTDAIAGNRVNSDSVVTLEGPSTKLIILETLREWLNITGNVKVSVRPVIDLNQTITTNSYTPNPRLRGQVIVRDRTCAFPWCERPARHLDLDHIVAWQNFDGGAPPGERPLGQTSSVNLAPLCRQHHRAKTFCGWTYTMIEPGTYLWTSPHGLRFTTDADGTTDLE